MVDEYVSIPKVGDQLLRVSPSDLTIDKAHQIVEALLSGGMNWVKIVESYAHRYSSAPLRENLAETVVFDAEVELPQRPKHPIAKIERIAVTFNKEDRLFPRVFALRKDFPLVPHINLEPFEIPRSLCLFDLPYSEVKLRWTAISFVERIRNWLADTAAGELHKSDQALEPLLFEPDAFVIFPPKFLSNLSDNPIGQVRMVVDEWQNGKFCFVAENAAYQNQPNPPRFLVVGITGESQQHGTIRSRPTTISGLSDFLVSAKTDLLAQLRTRLSETIADSGATGLEALVLGLIVVVSLPKTREEGHIVESSDTYAFVCARPEESSKDVFLSVAEIGERIGLWQLHEGRAGLILPPDASKNGDQIGLWMLAPSYPLSRENAPILSGTGQRVDEKLVAVGLGALGSQVFLNLVRTGDGEWTTIDRDILLPHNFIRHAAYGSIAGLAKSRFSTYVANATIETPPISTAIIADVLSPGAAAPAVESAFSNASIIFDFSASQAVARHMALDVKTGARRVSAFLNPSGMDVVILAEDAERTTTLDSLEMQYYRLIIVAEDLAPHLRIPDGHARYATGCRDVSNTILPELVARAAAIASSAIRDIFRTSNAIVAIWHGNELGEIKKITAPVGRMISESCGGWTILTDEIVIEKIRTWRKEKLPVETGGTLVGTYDMQRKRIYVADALPAPSDSVEKRSSFVRGSYGLKPMIESIKKRTLENLQYVGEWHSHPAGHSASPSKDDRKLLATIAGMQHKDGNPALMLIYGEDCISWHTA